MASQITKLRFKLSHSPSKDEIPAIGLGTYVPPSRRKPGQTREAVKVALQNGYRHIDTALAYKNEEEVGLGIKDSGLDRKDIWVTTKLHNIHHHKVQDAIAESLRNMDLEYVDLFLMHWPCSTDPDNTRKQLDNWDFVKTWIEMQKLAATGQVRNLGVSNFAPRHLEALEAHPEYKIVPVVNQIELHPSHPSPKYMEYYGSKGIHLTAYSCLGATDSPLYRNQRLITLAEKKGKSLAQILLMWGVQRGTSVIPKSVTPERIVTNFDLDGWTLNEEEMAEIDALPERVKVCGEEWLPEGIKVFSGDDE